MLHFVFVMAYFFTYQYIIFFVFFLFQVLHVLILHIPAHCTFIFFCPTDVRYLRYLILVITGFLQVNEECSTLRLSLNEAQQECEVAKSEVSTLQLKVQNLETLVQVGTT